MTRSALSASMRGEAGFALVEVTVAAAILTVVLIPITAVGVGFLSAPPLRHELQALSLARGWMEESLHVRAFTDSTGRSADGRWRLRRTAVRHDGLVTLTVEIYRASDAAPRITLTTVRPAEPP